MDRSPSNTKWASVKLHREFARWLKIEAVKKDVHMGDLVEQLVKQAVGSAPWRKGDGRPK